MADPIIEQHWPELAALEKTLDRLTNSTYTAPGAPGGDLAAQGRQIQLALDAYKRRTGR